MDAGLQGRRGNRVLGRQPRVVTIWNGCVTEVYYPTIDRPQVRDLQLLVTDGTALFQDEKKHVNSRTERSSSHALCYRLTNADREGRYQIVDWLV